MVTQPQNVRYLGFISLVLGFAVISWLKPVLMPLIIALFMLAVAWPITKWLKHIFPKSVSHILAYVALILIIGAFGGLTYFAISQFINQMPQYESQFFALIEQGRSLLRSYGLPAPRRIDTENMQQLITPVVTMFYTTLGHIILIVGLVILGLPELVFWEDKLKNCLGENNGSKWREAGSAAATSFQKYMSVTIAIGILSAILTSGFSLLIGLDFALLWGLLAFIMNFIPVLGALLVLIPPVIIAIIQFDSSMMVWVAFIGFGIIQFFIGNIIDPKYQGKYLSMSPMVILLSIAFWSFLWGPVGAFLSVPLTHIFMITCFQFPHTKRLACLLSEGKGTCSIG